MSWNQVLGALLGGATRAPRRRIRRTGLPMGGGGQMALARTLAQLATVAIEAMNRPSPSQPTPASAPRGRSAAAGKTGASPAAGRSARLPDWTTAPASRPEPRPASPYTPPAQPEIPAVEEAEALVLIRSMIAASKADGTVDAEERRVIAEQLDSAGLSASERDFVLADFETPQTPEALAKQASDPMMRARLYAAAVAAMDEITAPERLWLDRLSKALGLDRQAAKAIEERLAL